MLKLKPKLLFSPDDTPGTGEELSVEKMIDFMKDDDEKPLKLKDEDDDKDNKDGDDKDVKKEKDDEDKDDDKDKDKDDNKEKNDEDELKLEKDEIDEELITPVRKREILAKYPKLFKDFPYLEVAYYRDRQFTEILPTVEDAKAAVEKSNILDAFESDLINGDIEKVLIGLKKSNQESLNKLVDNLLPTLYKVDTGAYSHVFGNVIRYTIATMAREAKNLGDKGEPLEAAALLLNQFVFGTTEFTSPTSLAKPKEKDEREEKLSREKQEFVQQKFEDARDNLSTKVENVLKATIEVNIDPKDSMTDYVKKTAIRDARENLTELMDGDTRFKVILDKLWENAFKSNFSQDSLAKIRSTYLSRAKTLLPQVIKKARNEALKGLGKKVNDSEDETPRKKGILAPGKSTSLSSSGKSAKDQAKSIPHGMKSIDYLMQD